MTEDAEGSFSTPKKSNNSGSALNGHDCPHCGIWFRLDDAKPAGMNKIRCPNCDWVIEGA